MDICPNLTEIYLSFQQGNNRNKGQCKDVGAPLSKLVLHTYQTARMRSKCNVPRVSDRVTNDRGYVLFAMEHINRIANPLLVVAIRQWLLS